MTLGMHTSPQGASGNRKLRRAQPLGNILGFLDTYFLYQRFRTCKSADIVTSLSAMALSNWIVEDITYQEKIQNTSICHSIIFQAFFHCGISLQVRIY